LTNITSKIINALQEIITNHQTSY